MFFTGLSQTRPIAGILGKNHTIPKPAECADIVSAVEGFAVTLAIGVFISMFTAILVTRTLVRVILGRAAGRLQERKGLMGI